MKCFVCRYETRRTIIMHLDGSRKLKNKIKFRHKYPITCPSVASRYTKKNPKQGISKFKMPSLVSFFFLWPMRAIHQVSWEIFFFKNCVDYYVWQKALEEGHYQNLVECEPLVPITLSFQGVTYHKVCVHMKKALVVTWKSQQPWALCRAIAL